MTCVYRLLCLDEVAERLAVLISLNWVDILGMPQKKYS